MENILYNKIKQLCEERNITISKLESDLGFGNSSINKWKNSTSPSIDKVISIAKYFDVSIDYLTGTEESSNIDDMSKNRNYMKFIIAYDFGWIFNKMSLACDEAFELAEEIIKRYTRTIAEEEEEECYETLNSFCNDISFSEIWEQMKNNADLINTINQDIEEWEKENNKDMVFESYMYLNECRNSKNSGLYQLILNGQELWYGTLQEINAVVKSMLNRLTKDYSIGG